MELNAVSYYYRVYLAALSAVAEQNSEITLLQEVRRLQISLSICDSVSLYHYSQRGARGVGRGP